MRQRQRNHKRNHNERHHLDSLDMIPIARVPGATARRPQSRQRRPDYVITSSLQVAAPVSEARRSSFHNSVRFLWPACCRRKAKVDCHQQKPETRNHGPEANCLFALLLVSRLISSCWGSGVQVSRDNNLVSWRKSSRWWTLVAAYLKPLLHSGQLAMGLLAD